MLTIVQLIFIQILRLLLQVPLKPQQFLKEKQLSTAHETLASMFERYQAEPASVVITVR